MSLLMFVSLFLLILSIISYAIFNAPRRYRRIGPWHAEQAIDHLNGDFDRAYDIEPTSKDPQHPRAGRNSPCPCGSGIKHKKCCLGGS